jgi:hypothetical protein
VAAEPEPPIDPEILNAHHRGTLTALLGARVVEATKARLVAELSIRAGAPRSGKRASPTRRGAFSPSPSGPRWCCGQFELKGETLRRGLRRSERRGED